MERTIFDYTGKKKGNITIPEDLFVKEWNDNLIHDVIVAMDANARSGAAHTKTRDEKRGGGRKPYRQKGTGRARHGSIRSPIFVGGGTTFGPRNEKNYTKKINKKVYKQALSMVLGRHLQKDSIILLDSWMKESKTKQAAMFFQALEKEGCAVSNKKKGVLVVTPSQDVAVYQSFRNLPFCNIASVQTLNPRNTFEHAYILFVQPEMLIKELENRVK